MQYTYADLIKATQFKKLTIVFIYEENDTEIKTERDFNFDVVGDKKCEPLFKFLGYSGVMKELYNKLTEEKWKCNLESNYFINMHQISAKKILNVIWDTHPNNLSYILEFLTNGYINVFGKDQNDKERIRNKFRDFAVVIVDQPFNGIVSS